MEKKAKSKDDFDPLGEEIVSLGPGYYAKVSAKRDKETKKITLSVWRPLGKLKTQNISFGKKEFMDEVIKKLHEIEKNVGWKLSDSELQNIEIKRLSSPDDIKKLKDKIRKKDASIKILLEKLDQNDISQIREVKFQDAFKQAHSGFKEKIDSNDEREIQKYVSQHLWLISPEYYGQTKRKLIGGQFDFKVEKLGGFYDIVEIKKPKINLFVGDISGFATNPPSKTPVLDSKVKKALFQLMEYLERETATTQLRLGQAYRQGSIQNNEAVFKPKGTLIIGEFNTDKELEKAERMLLKQFNSYLHGIEIMTYTELLERSKLFADLKEKSNGVT